VNPIEFEEFLRFLRNAYGLAMYPTRKGDGQGEIVDFVFDRVGHVPSEALPWMRERLLSTFERFPGKIHAAILDAYQQWLIENPEKRAGKWDRTEHCRNPECDMGLLFLVGPDGYRTVFRCGCGRSELRGIPMGRFEQLRARGYVLSVPGRREDG
jgi:hypothetical protein